MSLIIQEHISLQPFNTFKVDVQASYWVELTALSQLPSIASNRQKGLPFLVIGGGSNMLFTQDFDGLVMKVNTKGIEIIQEDEKNVWIKAAAGEKWHDLVMLAVQHGWGGIENLALIPGTVGAAPIQNIGAYGVELKDVLDEVEVFEWAIQEFKILSNRDCRFGYRSSLFKMEAKGNYFISTVTLKLSKNPIFATSYGAIQEELNEKKIKHLTPRAISEAVMAIRRRKLPDPDMLGNAGSFFKNPEIDQGQYERLKKDYSAIPSFPSTLTGKLKIPAAWLIEQCGWKGKRIGAVGMHVDQPLVLVNYGGATGMELKQLADAVQRSVLEKFGIQLTPEVNIL